MLNNKLTETKQFILQTHLNQCKIGPNAHQIVYEFASHKIIPPNLKVCLPPSKRNLNVDIQQLLNRRVLNLNMSFLPACLTLIYQNTENEVSFNALLVNKINFLLT